MLFIYLFILFIYLFLFINFIIIWSAMSSLVELIKQNSYNKTN